MKTITFDFDGIKTDTENLCQEATMKYLKVTDGQFDIVAFTSKCESCFASKKNS